VLSVANLNQYYGGSHILRNLAFEVPAGKVTALLGRNGVGKSSLVRCLLGLQRPQSGTARLFGLDAWRDRRRLMEHVGVVPEEPDAPPELTARELVLFCGRLSVRWDEAATLQRLERFEVPLRTAFRQLSKGQKAAVMIALALGHAPDLLVLDDPTLGLDAVARRAVFGELIAELSDRGTTVLVTTHDLAGVEGIADIVGILSGGRLVLEGSLETLKAELGASLEEIVASVAGQRSGDAVAHAPDAERRS
jgi:ABC-2 type transport system ATP-binding protein